MTMHIRVLAAAVSLLLVPAAAQAHCDTMNGPVVAAGQQALARADLRPALIWIDASDESELRQVFAQAVEVRALGAQARELADRYFLETLVRLHRASEGEPFNGIEDASGDLGPMIPAVDNALHARSLEGVTRLLSPSLDLNLRTRFDEVLEKRAAMREDDLASGRAYVRAYVEFMHYVERLYAAAADLN